ncbi:transcriptional regulator [Marinomonas primoryensis]|uniref:Transcriptional regulator n=1 Tax=Marinomonas primoryensis TaxID=178399 RepID=A0A2Z4PR94_9GAMM|nr:AraC family ligand binding domain-containing protein [Marinomonas primoryensis]AWY00121.1 transcriptional regulator [Marinomonas primoryensis]
MSRPSSWPIPSDSIRFVLPRPIVSELSQHNLSKDIYPLAMGYYKNAAGHRMSRNQHDDYLLIYCVSGEGFLRIDQQDYRVSAGDLLVLPKNGIHSYRADESNPWSIYWLHCDGTLAADYFQSVEAMPAQPVLSLGLHPRLVADFEALLDMRQSSQLLVAYLHSSSLLRQIMTHIALLKTQMQHHYDKSLNMSAIQSLMLTHLHEKLDIETLAATANLSKYHFIKRYKALTGRTPINDFIHMKIERACHLLDISDQSMAEIGWAIGYEDAYYFSRVFHKVMGISPSRYRSIRIGKATYKE